MMMSCGTIFVLCQLILCHLCKSCPIQPLDSSFPIPIIHPFVKVERTHSKFYMAGFSPLPYRHLKPTPTPTPYTLRTPTTHTPYLTPHTSHCKSSYSYTHIAILPPLSSLRQASMTIWRELWWACPGWICSFFRSSIKCHNFLMTKVEK